MLLYIYVSLLYIYVASLEQLSPHEMLLYLIGQSPPLDDPSSERWYSTPYELTPISAATRDRWAAATAHPQLAFPRPNPYVPDDLTMLEQPAAVGTADGATLTVEVGVSGDDEALKILGSPQRSPQRSPQEQQLAKPTQRQKKNRAPRRLTSAQAEMQEGVTVWHLDAGAFDRPRASVLVMLRTPQVLAWRHPRTPDANPDPDSGPDANPDPDSGPDPDPVPVPDPDPDPDPVPVPDP